MLRGGAIAGAVLIVIILYMAYEEPRICSHIEVDVQENFASIDTDRDYSFQEARKLTEKQVELLMKHANCIKETEAK